MEHGRCVAYILYSYASLTALFRRHEEHIVDQYSGHLSVDSRSDVVCGLIAVSGIHREH